MALTNVRYRSGEPDLIIEVSAVPPNTQGTATTTGSQSVTQNGFTSRVIKAPGSTSQPGQGYAWYLYDWYTLYPIDTRGTFPDAELRWQIGQRQPNNVILRADYEGQMFPDPRHLEGSRRERVRPALSLRATYDGSGGGSLAATGNPAYAIGLPAIMAGGVFVPATEPFALRVYSTAGWGQSGPAVSALYFVAYLDILTNGDLKGLWPWFAQNSAFGFGYGVGGAVSGSFQWPAATDTPTSAEVLYSLPGQPAQNQITFELAAAANTAAVPAAQQYLFSDLTAITGAQPTNVDLQHDLGHAYQNTQSAFVPTLFGLRFSDSLFVSGQPLPQVYASMAVNGTTLPNPNENGILITAGSNATQWGSTAPQLGDRTKFFPMAAIQSFVQVLDYAQNMAPQAYSTSALAVGSLTVLQGGYTIQNATGSGASLANGAA